VVDVELSFLLSTMILIAKIKISGVKFESPDILMCRIITHALDVIVKEIHCCIKSSMCESAQQPSIVAERFGSDFSAFVKEKCQRFFFLLKREAWILSALSRLFVCLPFARSVTPWLKKGHHR
jgi:hypothetical protein